MAFDIEQEVSVSQQEVASVVAKYLEKRGLKKTLAKFIKEAKLVDGFERREEDLEAIYNSYIFASKSCGEPCKRKKTKKDALEPLQKETKFGAQPSFDRLPEADKTEAKKEVETDPGLVVQTEPVKVDPLLAEESAVGFREQMKVKKKSKKAKASLLDNILPQDPHSQLDKGGAYPVLNGSICDAVEIFSKGRLAEEDDPALNDKHALTCKGHKVKKLKVENLPSTMNELENKKHSTSSKASQNLDCSNEHLEESAVAKSKIFDKESGNLERKQRHKRLVRYVELSSGQITAQPSSDDDRKGKEVTSTTKRLVEADTDDGKHSGGPPVVTPEGLSKLKQDGGVRAFQRVKLEEVDFADPRLKNNSYWAKDGAEIGWGAKAEEVLGQVKGRDFRHEKTKKKRGSYKGGAIDLSSHSIKFNYTDDD